MPFHQRGATLIEALVALLVLSFCALGYAALQIRGVSSNSSAMWRSKAAYLSAEMADRMRANAPGVAAGAYDRLSAVEPPGCGGDRPCSTADMAKFDYAAWRTSLATSLPEGTGVVCIDSTPTDGNSADAACDGVAGSRRAIKVFWNEHGTEQHVWATF